MHLKREYDNCDHSISFYWLSCMTYTLVIIGSSRAVSVSIPSLLQGHVILNTLLLSLVKQRHCFHSLINFTLWLDQCFPVAAAEMS